MDCHPSSSEKQQRYCYNPVLRWNAQVEEYFIKVYGADHFARISKALTNPSCYSCIRVNILKSTTDAVMEKLKALLHEEEMIEGLDCMTIEKKIFELDEKDQWLRKERSPGMIKLEGTSANEEKPTEIFKSPLLWKCQFPGLDYVLFVKGSGPHGIQYVDQPDQPVKEVIVSRKCAEAVLRGAQIFVPGVLACSSHVEKGDTVAVSVAVEQQSADGGWGFGFTRGTVLQGSQADPQYHERIGLYIGQGITHFSRAGLFRALEGIAVEMTNRVYKLPSFNDLLEGEIFLQNLPSIVTSHVLDPQQGERILDMCAAPGGKTTAIAMLMHDKGEVIAVDRSHNKVMEIKRLAAEMGLTCIRAYRLDALKSVCCIREATDNVVKNQANEIFGAIVENSPSPRFITGEMPHANSGDDNIDAKIMRNGDEHLGSGIYLRKTGLVKFIRKMKNGPGRNHSMGGRAENSKGFLPNSFDRILLDAPCSALGLRPRLFAAEETIESLQVHAKYQRRMFDQAVQLVRPGGVIVYSTCTINPGENEALVRYALDAYKFLSLGPQNPRVGCPGLVGRCEHVGGKHSEVWLTQREAELVQRFDPSATLDTIGFFIAKFDVGHK